jgi:GrpB-like predicted nucleotidyltransferase (UPF0157 family)
MEGPAPYRRPVPPHTDPIVVVDPDPGWGALFERLGYRHEGDLGITGREAFAWPAGAVRHHLYLVVAGNPPHRDHVDFRDALRADRALVAEYGALKRRLAVEHRDDRAGYVEAKAEFIVGVLTEVRAGPRSRS